MGASVSNLIIKGTATDIKTASDTLALINEENFPETFEKDEHIRRGRLARLARWILKPKNCPIYNTEYMLGLTKQDIKFALCYGIMNIIRSSQITFNIVKYWETNEQLLN